MTSTAEICNLAISHARQDGLISNLDTDKSPIAVRLRRIYKPTLNRILQSFPWSFNTKTVSLSRLDATPYDGFDYVYSIPSNVLEVIKVGPEGTIFRNISPGSQTNIFQVFPSSDGLRTEIHSRIELAVAEVSTTTISDNVLNPLFVDYFAYELARQLANIYKVSSNDRGILIQELIAARSLAFESSAKQSDVIFDQHNTYVDVRGS